MAQALPFIEAGSAALGLVNGARNLFGGGVQAPQVLTQAQALQQAKAALDPIYANKTTDALHTLDNGLIHRGFFGQTPGAALEQYNIGQLGNEQAAAIANLASQLQGRSFSQASQAEQLAQQRQAHGLSDILGGIQGIGQLQSQYPTTWQHWFGAPVSDTIHAAGQAAANQSPLSYDPGTNKHSNFFNNPYGIQLN